MIEFNDYNGKTIVYTYGVFDLLHPGHIEFFKKCKKLGDILIVGIVRDKEVREVKDPKKPIMPEDWRFKLVENVKSVDYVLYQETYNPSDNLLSLSEKGLVIDILAKGDDMYQIQGIETIEKLGGRFIAPAYSPEYSTSDIIKKIVSRYINE